MCVCMYSLKKVLFRLYDPDVYAMYLAVLHQTKLKAFRNNLHREVPCHIFLLRMQFDADFASIVRVVYIKLTHQYTITIT